MRNGVGGLLEDCLAFYESCYESSDESYEKFLFTKKNIPFFRAEDGESNIVFCDGNDLGFDFMLIDRIGTATARAIHKRGITSLKRLVDEMDTCKFLDKTQRTNILNFWKTVGFLFFQFSFSLSWFIDQSQNAVVESGSGKSGTEMESEDYGESEEPAEEAEESEQSEQSEQPEEESESQESAEMDCGHQSEFINDIKIPNNEMMENDLVDFVKSANCESTANQSGIVEWQKVSDIGEKLPKPSGVTDRERQVGFFCVQIILDFRFVLGHRQTNISKYKKQKSSYNRKKSTSQKNSKIITQK